MKFMHYDQNQTYLLPPSLVECLPEDHICFVVNDVVNNIDLKEIENGYTEEGHPAYNPRIMIKILFYGYLQGTRSSRKLENKTYEDISFRYLTGNAHLDHGTINLFRQKHLLKLSLIFAQIIAAVKSLGLADFSDISIDGTKIKAQASKENLFTKEEIVKIKAKIETFLAESEKIDDEEDKKFGDKRGYNQIPKRLADPKVRREEILKIQKKLTDLDKADKEIDQKQEKAKEEDKKNSNIRKEKREQNKTNNLTSNTTDPESALMKMKDSSFQMAYNVGIAASKQFIAAYDITDDPSDTKSLPDMIKKTEENTKQKVKKIKADSAYFTKGNLTFLRDNQTEAFIPDTLMKSEERKENKANKDNTENKYDRSNFKYDEKNDQFICPEGKPLKLRRKNKNKNGAKEYKGEKCKDCPFLSLCAKGNTRYLQIDFESEEMRKTMRTKLNTEEGKQKYGERLPEIEPVMASLKCDQNFTEFSCVGKEMALVELGLASTAHNIKKIYFGLKRLGIKRKEIKWDSIMRVQQAQTA